MSNQIPSSALGEYFSECEEIIQRFSSNLSSIEKNGIKDNSIDALYRDMHTMKGSSQLFGFMEVGQVAHAMETALEPIRRLKIPIHPQLIDVLFKCVDLIERIVKRASDKQDSGPEFIGEIQALVPRLLSEATRQFGGDPEIYKDVLLLEESAKETSDKFHENPVKKEKATAQTRVADDSRTEMPITIDVAPDAEAPLVDAHLKELHKDDSAGGGEASSVVRIQVSLLDKLMNLAGELVLVRNQFLQFAEKTENLALLNLNQRLNLVTSELQGEVMKTRMQPIGNVLKKFQRVVRDLGRDLGKQIELTIEGSETELDKTLLEAIKDPLTHLIRNSCDHGIEPAGERIKNHKPAQGHILVKAYHEGGQVFVDISDDGRGLNYKRILEKALEKKLISPEKASSLTEREIGQLIFLPGFSTAENVSSVSGRGVGMDVVKTNLEKLGGMVELQSELGKGMRIRLRIPLTLAIVPALIVRSSDEQFAIPQINLVELVRAEAEGGHQHLEYLQGQPVFRLRGELLPLIQLSEVMGLPKKTDEKLNGVNIAVLKSDGEAFGLIVDEIRDTADIVVKPIPNFLKRLATFSGATIMGDGSVSLILDLTGLARRANLLNNNKKEETYSVSGVEHGGKSQKGEEQELLFFRLNSKEQFCLPLCLVQRLEEFNKSALETSGKQRIVQYRKSILPLVSLNDLFGLQKNEAAKGQDEKISVVVVQRSGRYFGIEVNEVVDILSVSASIEDPLLEMDGVLGSIIVKDNVATVIDVFGVLDKVVGGSRGKRANGAGAEVHSFQARAPLKVLLAEDTVFFMKQVKKLLESKGMTVVHAPDGAEAFRLLKDARPGEFQLVVSDIEMPNLNGFQLAEKVRGDDVVSKIPMIALTTRFKEADRKLGARVGFNRYLEKLRNDQLLVAIQEVMQEVGG